MEFIKDILDDRNKNTEIKQDEISGKQHTFHSLPKELQAWHNIQYMVEKKSDIDDSTVPESLLNAYMWKVIGDGSKFAIITIFMMISSIIHTILSPNMLGFTLGLIFYLPWLLYLMYHFYFYALLKAQVVGPVTAKSAKYTVDFFRNTFYSVFIALSISFVFIFVFLKDLAILLGRLIEVLSLKSDIVSQNVKIILIKIYNGIVDLLTTKESSVLAKLLSNIYVVTSIYCLITIIATIWFYKRIYKKRRNEVEKELEKEEYYKGYPIDIAMKKLTAWREENGV